MMQIDLFDLCGLTGVALSLYAYARLQWQREFAKRLEYSLLGVVNSLLLLISLSKSWNLAAFVGNCVWIFLSFYGCWRCMKYERQQKAPLPAAPLSTSEFKAP